jgi:glutamate formiminotransferase/glutamate formiminotransferase/formiminotetrahydrofolate cyclodeaminase
MPTLLAVPNISEGRERETIEAVAGAFAAAGPVTVLDQHSDGDHQRSVYTLAGEPPALADALLAGAHVAIERIDISDGRGAHPHVGALDVVPLVYLDADARGAACAEALVVADRIADELEVPVFLYGELAGGRTRAELRRGGVTELARLIAAGTCRPDFGPARIHRSAGATLVAAREPLVAFNVELAPPATVEDARAIASLLREGGGEGLPGVRAIGVALRANAGEREVEGEGEVAQVSTNIEHPSTVTLADVLAAVRGRAPVRAAELVGLAPRAALEGFPDDVPLVDFDASRHVIENALARVATH